MVALEKLPSVRSTMTCCPLLYLWSDDASWSNDASLLLLLLPLLPMSSVDGRRLPRRLPPPSPTGTWQKTASPGPQPGESRNSP